MSPQQQHEFNFPYQIGSQDSMSDTPAVGTPARLGRCRCCCCCCCCCYSAVFLHVAAASEWWQPRPGPPHPLCPPAFLRACRPRPPARRAAVRLALEPPAACPAPTSCHSPGVLAPTLPPFGRPSMPPFAQVAQRFSVEVKPGDIVVAATDGLFDNVYPDEAASLVAASKVRQAWRGAGGRGWRQGRRAAGACLVARQRHACAPRCVLFERPCSSPLHPSCFRGVPPFVRAGAWRDRAGGGSELGPVCSHARCRPHPPLALCLRGAAAGVSVQHGGGRGGGPCPAGLSWRWAMLRAALQPACLEACS